jgi:hypothetical protein
MKNATTSQPTDRGTWTRAVVLAGVLLALASCGSKAAQNGTPTDGGADGPPVCHGCGANQVCVSGQCLDVPSMCPCPKETYCDLGMGRCVIGCTSDDLCDTGRICLMDQRMCIAGCRGDTGCWAGQICDQLMCRAGCRDDSGCAAGQICEQSTCRAGCRADSGCAAGQICDQMMCRAGCRDDSGCAAGQICEQSLCRAGCRADATCGAGKICDDATLACRAGCRATADCPLEQLCNTTSTTCVAGCDGDARCAAGHICESGQCITGCRTDATCPTGQRCFNQICRTYCLADTDCPLEHVCVGNECVNGCGKPGGWPNPQEDFKRCPAGTTCRWSGCWTDGVSMGSCVSASCTIDCSPINVRQAEELICAFSSLLTTEYTCYGSNGGQRCLGICNGGSNIGKACRTAGQLCAPYYTLGQENFPYLCHLPCQSDADCRGLENQHQGTADCICQPAGSKYAGLCGLIANAAMETDICRYVPIPGSGGASGGGGAGGNSGTAGAGGRGGTGGTGGTGGASGPCAGLCANPTVVSPNTSSGDLGTSATCHSVAGSTVSFLCGNFASPRTLTVNGGTPVDCSGASYTLPAARNGGWCMQASAGNQSYAYFSTYNVR